jgi:hypothetical protein
MHRAGLERGDERGEIGGMGCGRVLLALVRPWTDPMIAIGVRDESVLLRKRCALRFPISEVADRTVDEDDRRTRALRDVREVGAVGADLERFRRFAACTPPSLQ